MPPTSKTLEAFALAKDRDAVIAGLAQGTTEHAEFLYQHLQNKHGGNPTTELKALYKKIEALKTSGRRAGDLIDRTSLLNELELRQQLLEFDSNSDIKDAFLREWISKKNIRFNHQREVQNRVAEHKQELPDELDEKLIDTDAVLSEQFRMQGSRPSGFEMCAHDWLSTQANLDGQALGQFLQILREPTPNIVELIARYSKSSYAKGTDILAYPWCRKLTIKQLNNLPKDVRQYGSFVNIFLDKLAPPTHVNLDVDLSEKRAFYERAYEFAKTMHAAQVSVKACIFFNRLKLLAELNEYDLEAFLEYLAIDRPLMEYNTQLLRTNRRSGIKIAQFNYSNGVVLVAIRSDVAIIQEYLAHFFRAGEPASKFSRYFDAPWLERLHAETLLLTGDKANSEAHIRAINNSRRVEQLRERIDIEFAKNNQKYYKPEDDIRMRVFLKNVPSLVVKVFEINTKAYYRKHNAPFSTDINLEGLQAKYENTHEFTAIDFERFEHVFEFSELKGKKGLFVVDLIGNGVHSRAILQIGSIRLVERESVAGHVFTLLNERNQIIKNGEIVFNGTPYTSTNEHGSIYIKYRSSSTELKDQQLLLTDKDTGLTCLGRFTHKPERYTLRCGIFCDREALLEKSQATVVVRPQLLINGNHASVALLQDVSLTVSTTERRVGNSSGTESSKKIEDFKVSDSEESSHTFTVPKDMRSVSFNLEAKVKTKSTQKMVDLQVSRSYSINVIDDSDNLQDLFLTKATDKYVISVLGKTGEPRAGAKVSLKLKHKFLSNTINVELQADAHGKVFLGTLPNIVNVTASSGAGRMVMSWPLIDDERTDDTTLNFMAAQPIAVPLMKYHEGSLRLTDVQHKRDYTNLLSFSDGFVEVKELDAGDYVLVDKMTQVETRINVCNGVKVGNYVVSGERLLELNKSRPLQIVSVTDGGHKIQLANWTPETRVHVTATHFQLLENSMFDQLAASSHVSHEPREYVFDPADSKFLQQRLISEEYRYVLERKNAKKYMGNMLERPGLLNNPWSHTTTKTAIKEAAAGEHMEKAMMHHQQHAYRGSASGGKGLSSYAARRSAPALRHARSPSWSNIEFLSSGANVHLNVKPDMSCGVVTLPSDAFGPHHHVISVLAMDTDHAVQRTVSSQRELGAPWTKEEVGTELDKNERFQDVRLYPGLDPEISATQQRNITLLQKGEALVIEDYKTGEFETFERLSEVLALYRTLASPPDAQTLNEFSFIAKWHKLDEDTKLFRYDKYSCHELDFFLFKKDPEFFNKVVTPFLRSKTQKTFMDHYLLGNVEEMRCFCEPFAYSTLNVVEKILLASVLRDDSTDGAANTLRFFDDKVSLMRVDAQEQERLFKTALKAKSLESEDSKRDFDDDEEMADMTESFQLSSHTARAPQQQFNQSQALYANVLPAPPAMAPGDASAGCAPMPSNAQAYFNSSMSAPSSARMAESSRDLAMLDVAQKPMFQELDETKEYEETQYYKTPWDTQRPDLISMSRFWADYARHMLGAGSDPNAPFLSKNFVEATRTFPEIMFALAVQSFPFESATDGNDSGVKLSRSQGHRLTVKALQPVAVFVQELLEAEQAHSTVMINQEYFDPSDATHMVDGERVDKFVTGEFLHSRIYGCRVTLTNVSTAVQNIEVLMQIPRGAIPVDNSSATRTQIVHLNRYTTNLLEVRFYFPFPGEFRHFPAQVSKNQKHIGRGNPKILKVVSAHTTADLSSWRYVSQEGSNAEVLAFLRAKNVHDIDLKSICWRMNDRQFFVDSCDILRQRHALKPPRVDAYHLLTYALKHGTQKELREVFLWPGFVTSELTGDLAADSGALIEFNPFLRKKTQHLEYAPLVNARVHQLGKERTILNDKFQEQYTRFLKQLCYKGTNGRDTLPVKDRLEATYYYLLQDRIDEAIELFKSIPFDAARDSGELHYDYMRAYLDFYTDNESGPQEAFDIAAKYRNCPINKKKKLFAEIERQLSDMNYQDEKVDHPDVAGVQRDVGDRDRLMDRAASAEVSVEATVESGKLIIDYLNIDTATVNFYEMDIELLFSTTPFMKEGDTSFSMVSPNRVLQVDLPPAPDHDMGVPQARRGGPSVKEVAVPDDLQSKNVFIEVIAGGIVRTTTHYANKMLVQITENYGQLRVTDRDSYRPIRQAYVKVYAKMNNGSVQFFKDGYTDLRGKFDYVSISTAQLKTTQKFSILVLSGNAGAVVREASPPESHK